MDEKSYLQDRDTAMTSVLRAPMKTGHDRGAVLLAPRMESLRLNCRREKVEPMTPSVSYMDKVLQLCSGEARVVHGQAELVPHEV